METKKYIVNRNNSMNFASVASIFHSPKANIFRSLLATIFLLTSINTCLYAALSGNIQLVIATPDPAFAGEKITFQIIALNNGTEKWLSKRYYFEVEIYDAQKKYIKKTDKLRGKIDIRTGETTLVYVHFNVLLSFDGEYFYKIAVTINEQKVISTKYYPFTIIPLTKVKPKAPPITIGGNAILSLIQTSRKYEIYGSSSDYTGSFNLNLVGKAYESPLSLNLYARYTKKDRFDLDNFLFNFYGKDVQVAFGDIQPAFNSLVLYGAGMRGINATTAKQRFSASVVVAESAEKVEGTIDTNGTYARYLWGGEIKQGLDILNGYLAGTYVGSKDAVSSLETPGPTLLPVKNNVIGGTGYLEVTDFLGIKADYAQSKYWEDISSDSVTDSGIMATLTLTNVENISLTGIYSRINPGFQSLGAPSSTNDKETYEISTGYSIPEWTTVSLYFNTYRDNLDDDPNQTTVIQNLASISLTLQRPKYPVLSIGYSLNIAKGDPETALDNQTITPSVSIAHTYRLTTMSISFQKSDFEDKTDMSDDLKTTSMNLSVSSRIGKNISASAGATVSTVSNIISSTDTNTKSYSISINFVNIIENKLSSALWSSYTKSEDEPQQSINNENITSTFEVTYNLRNNLSATLGITHAGFTNEISNSETYTEDSINVRFSTSF